MATRLGPAPAPSVCHTPQRREWERLAEVADMYWVQGMKVEEVGRRLSLSRSTVSRMLARARSEGVIEFRIRRAETRTDLLRRALQERFPVAASVSDASEDTHAGRLRAVGEDAASWIDALIQPSDVIAVSWGSTVDAMSLYLRSHPVEAAQVVQLHGWGSTPTQEPNYASRILDRFGSAFRAKVQYFPVPVFFDSASTRRAVWSEKWVDEVVRLRDRADLLVASVGVSAAEAPGHVYGNGYLDARDRRELEDNHVIGNLGAVFFREGAATDGISVNDRSTGMPFEQIRQIRTRMLLAADPAKAVAVHTLLDAGLITHVALDTATAQAVLGAASR